MYTNFSYLLSFQKQSQKSESGVTAGDAPEKDKSSRPLEPYRRMLPGMKLKKEPESERVGGIRLDGKPGEGEEQVEEEEGEKEDEERPSLPTPRKRLLNFKIPLVRGAGQRRDQQMSVVARRKLFRGGTCVSQTTFTDLFFTLVGKGSSHFVFLP